MIQHYPQLDEQVFRRTLANGLPVTVVARPGFGQKVAYFVTNFGSVHTDFRFGGAEYHVPAGVAHFLEHKMFELPRGDVTAEFAALGARVNAFTSYDMTAYYFSCTEHFDESLRLLLEFVSTPYFPAQSVERERGIIDQEIAMNEDAPDSQVFERLMTLMYRVHPIRVPILGTRESIRAITPEILLQCHQAFYTPANMMLCVVGDVDPESVCTAAEDVLGCQPRPAGEKLRLWQEPPCPGGICRGKMDISMPTFQIGFPCESIPGGEAAMRQEVAGDLAAEALFGESSPLYRQLYEQGLIDGSFGGGFESVDGCAMLTCGGDSAQPEKVRDAILARAERLVAEGISPEELLRMKRSALGRRIRGLDSFDSTCFRVCAYSLIHYDYFSFPGIYRSVAPSQVREFLEKTVLSQHCCMSILEPVNSQTYKEE